MTITDMARARLPHPFRILRRAFLPAALALLAWRWPSDTWQAAGFVFDNMIAMAPIIALAVVLPAAIAATGSGARLERLFEGRMMAMIVSASAIGAITPICGVGVAPLIASLLSSGVPLAPVMAFWLDRKSVV